jgi:hypothetical protein
MAASSSELTPSIDSTLDELAKLLGEDRQVFKDYLTDILDKLKVLMGRGNYVITEHTGSEPLLYLAAIKCIEEHSTEGMHLLINAGLNPNWEFSQTNFILPCMAAGEESKSIVELLLRIGADLNIEDHFGETLLFRAVIKGDEGMVSLLLNAKANPDIANNRGETPLFTAVRRRNEKITFLLLNAGANPNMATETGTTHIHKIVTWDAEQLLYPGNNDKVIARLLLAANKIGETAFHKTAQSPVGRSAARLLLNAGAAPFLEVFYAEEIKEGISARKMAYRTREATGKFLYQVESFYQTPSFSTLESADKGRLTYSAEDRGITIKITTQWLADFFRLTDKNLEYFPSLRNIILFSILLKNTSHGENLRNIFVEKVEYFSDNQSRFFALHPIASLSIQYAKQSQACSNDVTNAALKILGPGN